MRAWIVVLAGVLLAGSAAIAADNGSKAPACPSPSPAASAEAPSPAPPAEEIVAGGIVILRLRATVAGKTPAQRTGMLYERLNTIISDRTLLPGSYRAVQKGKDWVVMAGKNLFVTVTNEEAAANKVPPAKLAATWAQNLRRAVAAARPIPLPWEETAAGK